MRNKVLVLALVLLAVVVVPVGGWSQELPEEILEQTPEILSSVCSRDFEKLAASTAEWLMLHTPSVGTVAE